MNLFGLLVFVRTNHDVPVVLSWGNCTRNCRVGVFSHRCCEQCTEFTHFYTVLSWDTSFMLILGCNTVSRDMFMFQIAKDLIFLCHSVYLYILLLCFLQSVEDVRPLLRDKYKLHELIEAAIPPPAATAPMCYQPSV